MKVKTMIASSVMTLAAVGTVTAYAATTTTSNSSTATHTKTASHQGFHGKGIGSLDAVSKIIGIDSSTLQSDLKSGQSLAQIAQSKGIDEQTLVSDIESNQKTRLDQAVSNGKLTSTKEQQILTRLDSHVQQMVERTGVFSRGAGSKDGVARQGQNQLSNIAGIIGVDKTTIQSDLKAGQSLAEIAQTKGIDEQTLISDIESAQKTALDKAVQSGKLSATQEQKILSNQDTRVKQLVEKTGWSQKGSWSQHHGNASQTTSTNATSS